MDGQVVDAEISGSIDMTWAPRIHVESSGRHAWHCRDSAPGGSGRNDDAFCEAFKGTIINMSDKIRLE
jgi:hypothetical protein